LGILVWETLEGKRIIEGKNCWRKNAKEGLIESLNLEL
jgi:hypothetical protein